MRDIIRKHLSESSDPLEKTSSRRGFLSTVKQAPLTHAAARMALQVGAQVATDAVANALTQPSSTPSAPAGHPLPKSHEFLLSKNFKHSTGTDDTLGDVHSYEHSRHNIQVLVHKPAGNKVGPAVGSDIEPHHKFTVYQNDYHAGGGSNMRELRGVIDALTTTPKAVLTSHGYSLATQASGERVWVHPQGHQVRVSSSYQSGDPIQWTYMSSGSGSRRGRGEGSLLSALRDIHGDD